MISYFSIDFIISSCNCITIMAIIRKIIVYELNYLNFFGESYINIVLVYL